MTEEPPRLPTHPVVWILVGAIGASYLAFKVLSPEAQNAVDLAFALIPERFIQTSPIHFTAWWEMLGPILGHPFLHVAWWHAAANGFFFFLFARLPALRLGAWRFLVVFFASSVAGALVFLALNWGSNTAAVGASGAVCGVFTAYFLAARRTWLEALRDPAVRNPLGTLFFLNVVVMGVLSKLGLFPIAWEAHLGGFIGGALSYIALECPPRPFRAS